MPQSINAKSMLGYGPNLDMLKERYNEHYDTIVDELNKTYIKNLLKLPDKISGYYCTPSNKSG
jgi:hypothetical protein